VKSLEGGHIGGRSFIHFWKGVTQIWKGFSQIWKGLLRPANEDSGAGEGASVLGYIAAPWWCTAHGQQNGQIQIRVHHCLTCLVLTLHLSHPFPPLQMLKNSSFPGSNNGTGLFQTIVGLKVSRVDGRLVRHLNEMF
jgi:hypothetical protein